MEFEIWNLIFAAGILLGGVLTSSLMPNSSPIEVNPKLVEELSTYGITDYSNIIPNDIFSWEKLLTVKGFLLLTLGGFLVGFGTRYAGGCTSGHAISGLSNLQLPSLIAVIGFFIGGLIMAHFLLPLLF